MSRMTRTGDLVVLLVLGTSLAGCGYSGSSVAPTRPSSAGSVPPPIGGGQSISGTVSDTALSPLAGATVELLDGPQAGRSTTTNSKGEFSLVGTVDDSTRFRASREGHLPAVATIQPDCERCNPRRWVHLFLNVLDPPAAIAGDYTLTLTAEGLNYFWLNIAGNNIAVVLGDHTDPGVTERIGESTYVAYGGWATVTVDSPVSTISTPFQGWIDSCVNPQMGIRYDCSPSSAVMQARCNSTKHHLTLARR